MARVTAFLFFLGGLARVWFDWRATISQAEPFRFADIGTLWANFHLASLEVAPGLIARFPGAWLWDQGISRVLVLPVAPTLLVLAAVLLVARRK